MTERIPQTQRDMIAFGDNLRRWRLLHGLTAEIVASRANISRKTLRSLESGTGAVGLDIVFTVLRVLGVNGAVVDATEPLNTDLGRLNADRMLPQRVVASRSRS